MILSPSATSRNHEILQMAWFKSVWVMLANQHGGKKSCKILNVQNALRNARVYKPSDKCICTVALFPSRPSWQHRRNKTVHGHCLIRHTHQLGTRADTHAYSGYTPGLSRNVLAGCTVLDILTATRLSQDVTVLWTKAKQNTESMSPAGTSP